MRKQVALKYYWLIVVISVATAIGLNNLILVIDLATYSPTYQEAVGLLYTPPFLQQIFYTGILMPILEEILFRGGVFKLLRRWVPFWAATAVSSLLFGIYHGNLVQFVYASLCGLLLAYLYEVFGSVKAPVMAHMCMNLVACILTKFGIFTWMFQSTIRLGVITGVCIAIIVAVFVSIRKKSKIWMLQKC